MSRTLWVLVGVTILAAVLRLVAVDIRPMGFTWDEAALGYNAYSLWLTGRDEHAQTLPVVLKSFGDYKPGLYAYFAVPAVALLGLTETAVRIPAAILGTLATVGVFLLAFQLVGRKAAIFSSLVWAINPWAIHFSRGAWEANLALLLTLLGTVLLIRRRLGLAAVFLGLTFWAYQGAKMFTPLLILAIWVSQLRQARIGEMVKFALVTAVFLIPLLIGLRSQAGRLKVFNVFGYTRPQSRVQEIMRQDNSASFDVNYYLWHSEKLDQIRGVVQRYLNHFSPRFLFIGGDWSNQRHATPYYGYFHLIEVVTLAVGGIVVLRSKRPGTYLLWVWLVLAPLPSALSRDIVSAVRSLPLVVPLVIISGTGLAQIWSRKLGRVVICSGLIFGAVYWLDLYFVHAPYFSASAWLYPYRLAIMLVNQHLDDYDRVVWSTALGQPYIYVLFYNRVDPRLVWQGVRRKPSLVGDVEEVTSYGKYSFTQVDWPARRGDSSTLFVGTQWELPERDMNPPNLVRLGEIYYPNGAHGLRVVGLK